MRTRRVEIEPLAAGSARLEPGTVVLGPGVDSPRIRRRFPPAFELPDPALNYPDGQRLIELARDDCGQPAGATIPGSSSRGTSARAPPRNSGMSAIIAASGMKHANATS